MAPTMLIDTMQALNTTLFPCVPETDIKFDFMPRRLCNQSRAFRDTLDLTGNFNFDCVRARFVSDWAVRVGRAAYYSNTTWSGTF